MAHAPAVLLSVTLLGAACNSAAVPPTPMDAATGDAAVLDAAARDLSAHGDAALPSDAAAGPEDLAMPIGGARFAFAIAPGSHPLHYQYAQLQPAVDALGAAAFTLRLTGDDVARYRVEKGASPRVEIVPTPAAAARIQADPNYGFALHGAYFDVRLDDQRQYVAIGWERVGAAAIDAPVVHAETVSGTFVLRIGAYLGAWVGRPPPPNAMVAVDTQEMRDYFRSRAALDTVAQLGP